MANRRKAYFLVPGWDMPPAALSLGDILTDPTRPHRPLNTTPLTPLLANLPIHRTELAPYIYTHSVATTTKLGLWTQFLHIFGLGGEAAVSFGLEDGATYRCDRLETEWCAPPLAVVREAVARPDVQSYLELAGAHKPLYIVTELKRVTGASVSTKKGKKRGVSGKIGIDATAAGVPVSVGPEVDIERERGEEVDWKCEGSLIFAFQLQKVKLRRSGLVVEDFVQGAVLVEEEEEAEKPVEVDCLSDFFVDVDDDGVDEFEDVIFHSAVDEADREEYAVIAPVVAV